MGSLKNRGVYKITNTENGKVYIGSSSNLKSRKYQHFNKLGRTKHDNPILQRSYNKIKRIHGDCEVNNYFTWEVIHFIDYCSSIEELKVDLLKWEQYYIDLYKSCNRTKGYNICPNAYTTLGRKMKEKQKKLLSTLAKQRGISKESRRKMTEGQKGRVLSEDTKKKIGLGNKGKIVSEATRTKLSKALKGKRHSKERVEINRQVHLGQPASKNSIEGMRKANIKKVRNINTGDVFNSIGEAVKFYNFKSQSKIGEVCSGKRKTAYGYGWEFIK